MDLLKQVNDILVKYDPEGLIKIGAPLDEYGSEAKRIIERLDNNALNGSVFVFFVVYTTFAESFFPMSSKGKYEVYQNISRDIEHLWRCR